MKTPRVPTDATLIGLRPRAVLTLSLLPTGGSRCQTTDDTGIFRTNDSGDDASRGRGLPGGDELPRRRNVARRSGRFLIALLRTLSVWST